MKPDLSGTTVLIVDDDKHSLILYEEFLVPTKAVIIKAASGCEALSQTSLHKPKVILLDLKLGDCTGYSLVSQLKSIVPDAIIIAQSASVHSESLPDCINIGFHDFISKPILRHQLFDALRKHLVV